MNSIIEKNKDSIEQLCIENKVDKLYAFGSVLTDKFNNNSDLDFIVALKSDNPIEYSDNYFDLLFGFEDLFGKKVDLLEEKTIKNPYLKQNIDRNKVLIYG